MPPAKPRRCTGKTKAGKRCKAFALHGTKPPRCLAHSDAKTRAKVGFVADNGKGGRKRKPRASEVEHQLLSTLLRPHIVDAVERLVALTESTNENVAVRANAEVLDRYYGKPRQTVDVDLDPEDREPAEIDADLAGRFEQALRDAGVDDEVVDDVLPRLPA